METEGNAKSSPRVEHSRRTFEMRGSSADANHQPVLGLRSCVGTNFGKAGVCSHLLPMLVESGMGDLLLRENIRQPPRPTPWPPLGTP